MPFLISVVRFLGSLFKSRRELLLEKLALRQKDPPETRTIERPESGKVVAFPQVGGLHHRYGRIAA